MGSGGSIVCGICLGKNGTDEHNIDIKELDADIGLKAHAENSSLEESEISPPESLEFLSQISKATTTFLSLISTPDPAFELVITKDQCKVFSKDTSLGFVLMAEWLSPHPAEQFIKFLSDLEIRRTWDKNIETVTKVRSLDEQTGLYYQTYRKVMAMAQRDLVYINQTFQQGAAWVDISTSIDLPEYPEREGVVRIKMNLGGYYAVPLEVQVEGMVTKVVCASECSFGGAVPKGLVKMISASALPTFAKDVTAALNKSFGGLRN